MYFRIKFLIVAMLLIYIFPVNVFAYEDVWTASFLAFDSKGQSYWTSENIVFDGNLSKEDKTKYIFTRLFKDSNKENVYTFPKGIEIYDVKFKGDLLILNISRDILYYSQGSYYEVILKNKIVKTALGIENINKVTLLIEGELANLSKGSTIYRVSEWDFMNIK